MSNGFQKFISGKGFYLALAVCLAGAGAAAWVAVDKTIDNIEQSPLTQTPQTQQEENYSQPAEQKLENIQKDSDVPSGEAPAADDSSSKTAENSAKTPDSLSADKDDSSNDSDSSMDALPPSAQPESSSAPNESSEASAPSQQPERSVLATFSLPVSGAAITPFSGDMLVKNETLNDWRTHNGIDISAAVGSIVTASCDGIVTDVRSDPLWGNVVEVSCGEYVMTYAGLADEIPVAEEMPVSAGEVIGSVGEIPCELLLEPHLHFDVKQNGKYVDPASLAK